MRITAWLGLIAFSAFGCWKFADHELLARALEGIALMAATLCAFGLALLDIS